MGHTELGREGEAIASAFLKKKGYRILAKNYRNKIGEIDLIARDRDTIVFVEVKTRRTEDFGSPKWAVTPAKQRKISMVALYYLKETGQTCEKARFDVVTVKDIPGKPLVEIIQNAFDLAYP